MRCVTYFVISTSMTVMFSGFIQITISYDPEAYKNIFRVEAGIPAHIRAVDHNHETKKALPVEETNQTLNLFIDPNPNAFHMFENFIMNRKVFIDEQKLTILLYNVRKKLFMHQTKLQNSVKQNKNNTNMIIINEISMLTSKNIIKDSYFHTNVDLSKENEETTEVTQNFPKIYDYDGAVKGIVILHNTYFFDLSKTRKQNLSNSNDSLSEISYYEVQSSKEISFSSQEQLKSDDFLMFAHRAANFYHFFDSAILFIKEAFESFPESTSISMYGYMLEIRKNIIHLHNHYLLERQKLIGKQFRVLPLIFNETFHPRDPKVELKGIF